jgi:hypothetical protein
MLVAAGGYCTQPCEVDVDCGAGGVCPITLGGGRCFNTCTMESECRDGYVCGERGIGNMPPTVCTPLVPDADAGVSTDAGTDAG